MIGALIRFELRRWFASALGWGVLAASAFVFAWWLLAALDAYLGVATELAARTNAPGITDLVIAPYLASVAAALLVVAPLAGMRALADEGRARTLPWLATRVGSPLALALGKWLSISIVLLAIVALGVGYALALAIGSDIDTPRVLVAGLGLGLLALALGALAVLTSAFARHAPTAAGAALVIGLLLWIADAGARARGEIDGLINWIALPGHIQPFVRGVIDSGAVAYFALFIVACLALTVWRVAHLRDHG